MLPEDLWFYSVFLHCNEGEFNNGDYNSTVGIIDKFCSSKADIEEIRGLIENAVRCNEMHPVSEHGKPTLDDTISAAVASVNVRNSFEKGYDLGFGYLGNGITVWNRLQEEYGDYKKVAHISPNCEVKYYDENLPKSLRQKIEDYKGYTYNFGYAGSAGVSCTAEKNLFRCSDCR